MLGKKKPNRSIVVMAMILAVLAATSMAALAQTIDEEALWSGKVFPNREDAVVGAGFDLTDALVMKPIGHRNGITLYRIELGAGDIGYALVETAPTPYAFADGHRFFLAREVVEELGGLLGTKAGYCAPDGGFDDTLGLTSCCSARAVSGSTSCFNPSDFGTTWASCSHVCASALVGGCVPSGGVDGTVDSGSCCGSAVSGSTRCLNPAHYGTTWKSCVHTCS